MKKLFLLIVAVCLYSFSWALTTITTNKINGSPLYGGQVISVKFTVDAPANAGNIFTAQLSDKKGNFASPVNIGTLAGTTSGTISATIPVKTATGSKYLIRVVSSIPVVTGTPCPNSLKINLAPKNLVVSAVTACSTTLSWDVVTSALSYDVRYKATNGGSFSNPVNTTALSYNFTGLISATSYEFDVRAKYPNNAASSYAAATSSTTGCPVPGNLFASAIGVTTASLDWPDATCASNYSFRYRLSGTTPWTYKHPVTSTINLTGLCPGCDYEAQVATRCSSTDSSAYGNTDTWEENYFRLAGNSDGSYIVVYPNPSNGAFSLNFNNADANGTVDIAVRNMYGQIIYHATQSITSGLNEMNVNMNNASAGMYFVKVKSGNEEFNSSVVVK